MDLSVTKRPKIGLALGGGAARGFAHIGILRTLLANGIVPDIVVGTSIGAVVGGSYACGHLDTLEEWARGLVPRNIFSYLDIRLNGSGLIGGDKLAAQLTWLSNRHVLGLPEDRRHERVVPKASRTLLVLDSGHEYPCRVIDVSLSGAAAFPTWSFALAVTTKCPRNAFNSGFAKSSCTVWQNAPASQPVAPVSAVLTSAYTRPSLPAS